MDPKLIIFAAVATLVGLYLLAEKAYDAGWFAKFRLPWGGAKEPTAQEAIDGLKVAAKYFTAKGLTMKADTCKSYATEVFGGTL